MSRRGQYNAADEDQVEARRQQEKLDADQAREDMRTLMEQPAFRRYQRALIAQCGLYRTSFTGNSTTFFNEGARNIGLWIHAQIVDACPERLIDVLREEPTPQEQSDG